MSDEEQLHVNERVRKCLGATQLEQGGENARGVAKINWNYRCIINVCERSLPYGA
jgi:hypothetical protein